MLSFFPRFLIPILPFVVKHHYLVTTPPNIMSALCESPFPLRKCIVEIERLTHFKPTVV